MSPIEAGNHKHNPRSLSTLSLLAADTVVEYIFYLISQPVPYIHCSPPVVYPPSGSLPGSGPRRQVGLPSRALHPRHFLSFHNLKLCASTKESITTNAATAIS